MRSNRHTTGPAPRPVRYPGRHGRSRGIHDLDFTSGYLNPGSFGIHNDPGQLGFFNVACGRYVIASIDVKIGDIPKQNRSSTSSHPQPTVGGHQSPFSGSFVQKPEAMEFIEVYCGLAYSALQHGVAIMYCRRCGS